MAEELVAPVELVSELLDVPELPVPAPPLVVLAMLLLDVLLALVAWLPPAAENATWPVMSNWLCGGGGTAPEPTPDDMAVVAEDMLPADDRLFVPELVVEPLPLLVSELLADATVAQSALVLPVAA